MTRTRVPIATAVLLVFCSLSGPLANAQDRSKNQVPVGVKFLASLAAPINTKDNKQGDRIELRTLEPLTSVNGKSLPEGALIHAHIDKIEQAHQAGRARMWLTFDEIETERGWVPLVAVVSDIPGVHSVKVQYNKEGEIETRSSGSQDEATATAAGALVGAAPGIAARNEKDAAFGAAVGAATAFMTSSGLGKELTLDQNTKIELTLDRPLNLGRR